MYASPVTCVGIVCPLELPGSTGASSASYINSSGDVTGTSYNSSGIEQTYLYIAGTEDISDLEAGLPGGISAGDNVSGTDGDQVFLYENDSVKTFSTIPSYGYSLNDSGTVVGTAQGLAFSWNGSSTQQLGTLGGSSSTAELINDAGDIAGYSNTDVSSQGLAFYLQAGYELPDGNCNTVTYCAEITLGSAGGDSQPNALNSSGQMVGFGYLGQNNTGAEEAFLYTPGPSGVASTGTTTPLGTLEAGDAGNSDALAINYYGVVVGYSSVSSSPSHAFVYSNSVMTDLGTPDNLTNSQANAINDSGVIVGTAFNTNATLTQDVAFVSVYDPISNTWSMNDLNQYVVGSGLTLLTATGINNADEIIGQAETADGVIVGYELNYADAAPPTPEPSTVISDGLGALLLCAAAYRRKAGLRK